MCVMGLVVTLQFDNTEFPKPPVTLYSLSHTKLSVQSQIAVTASYSHLQKNSDMQGSRSQ